MSQIHLHNASQSHCSWDWPSMLSLGWVLGLGSPPLECFSVLGCLGVGNTPELYTNVRRSKKRSNWGLGWEEKGFIFPPKDA